jgi:hypothetical protein
MIYFNTGIVGLGLLACVLIPPILVIGILFMHSKYIIEGIIKIYLQADAIYLDSLVKKRNSY